MSHDERVKRVAEQVRARAAAGDAGRVSLGKREVSHFVPQPSDPRHKDRKVDVRALREVLSIDAERRLCVAEPGVSFKDLLAQTLPLGLMPKLVPELEGITLGGAVSGCSVESMSYKFGGFHDSCREYEIVTGTGEIMTVTRESDPLLFDMLHGSYGTLAILTKLTFELIPARPFVHMEYVTHADWAAFERALDAAQRDPGIDFIDGIAHGPRQLVLCLGRLRDQAPRATSDYRRLDIFYKSTARLREDWLTLPDYLFRYDTEAHWLTRTLPLLERRLVRRLVGRWLLGSTNLLTWSKRIRPLLRLKKHNDVVVDVFIPGRRMSEFFAWYRETIDFWPMWMVPYRLPRPYPWARAADGDYFVDCAVYGKRNDDPRINYYKTLEDKTFELGGIKTLISENYYDEARFWEIYDREAWQSVKQRTDPANLFRDLYKKFHFLKDDRRAA
jgi:FAD/FMN-containing dehydrogenase